jgi:hypothetical protein
VIPNLLVQIALIIIIVRSVYVLIQRINASGTSWLDILFHAAIAIVALKLLW